MKKIVRECVCIIIPKNNAVLVEKRKKDKRLDPGILAIPGGGIEKNESFEQATKREAKEELGITVQKTEFLTKLIYDTPHGRFPCQYVIAKKWKGKIHSFEAEKVFWLPIKQVYRLGIYVDRQAMQIFMENQKRFVGYT